MSRGFIDGCEHEQLHLSGAIQPHGAVLKVDGGGYITHASANAHEVIGVGAEDVLGTPVGALNLRYEPVRSAGRRVRRQAVTHRGIALSVLAIVGSDGGKLIEMIPQHAPPVTPNVTQSPLAPADERELQDAKQRLVAHIAERTGHERTMYYQFHDDGHGEVTAEVRAGDAYGSYLGLHFPASDIPNIARALYLQNPWRMIPDATADPVALLARSPEPVDLTRSDLRSVSEVHRAYLANMGVRSSLSFPVSAGDSLDALISCHHSGVRQTDVALLDDLAASVDAFALAALAMRARRRMRMVDGISRRFRDIEELAAVAAQPDDVWPVLGPRLMADFGADGALMCLGDTVYAVGDCPDADTLNRIESVAFAGDSVVWHSDSISRDVDDATLTPVAGAAGLLIATPARRPLRLWVSRVEHIDEVCWGGNPDKPLEPGLGGAPISPRHSFETWVERRLGHSRPWTTETELLLRHLRTVLRPLGRTIPD